MLYCISRLCYEHDVHRSVCLSVSLSVTLVGYDHVVQRKMEVGICQDSLVSWHGYLHAEAN